MIPRVFVGSDPAMGKAEIVLDYTLRKNASGPVDITWMRAGSPGWDDWEIGRPTGQPYTTGWATDFSCFRFAIPELCDFKGKAIYLDVDMLVLGDIYEIWEMPVKSPWASAAKGRTDVSLIDCSYWCPDRAWPTIEDMKKSGHTLGVYVTFMDQIGERSCELGKEWDCLDGRGFSRKTRLVHYTNMRTQPWKPWPERFDYPDKHPNEKMDKLFWDAFEEACPTV